MDRLKRSRRPVRTQFTKVANEIETELATNPVNKAMLEVKFEVLKTVHQNLTELDEKVREQMINEDLGEEDENLEVAEITRYEEKFITIQMNVLAVTEATIVASPPGSVRSSTARSVRTSTAGGVPPTTMKLPKLEFKTFSGEIKDWLSFWSSFRTSVDEHTGIDDCIKLQYLRQAMLEGTRARELVNKYLVTPDNYPKVVKVLTERYGKPDLLVEVHVRELLNIVIRNASTSRNNVDLCTLYDEIESHLRSLESLNVTADKYGALLYPMVESCLPVSVLRAWQRSNDLRHLKPDESKLQLLMNFVQTEVEGETRINIARQGFGAREEVEGEVTTRAEKPSKKKLKMDGKVPTAAALQNMSKEKAGCGFCGKPHPSEHCFTAQTWTLEQRRKKIQDDKRCYCCLKSGHHSKACKSRIKCIICSRKHLVIMCPELGKSSSSPEEKADDKKDTEETTSSINQSCSADVVLQTLSVIVASRNTARVRAFIDTGSQRSYILKRTVKEIGMKPFNTTTFTHSLFGGKYSHDVVHDMYKLQVQNLKGDYKCTFDVFDEETICGNIPRLTNRSALAELKRLKIELSDVGQHPGEVQLLIGADIYGKLLTGNVIQLEGGLTAVETFPGWTVMGKIPASSSGSSLNSVVLSVVNSLSSVTKLWEFEAIGILDPAEKLSKLEAEEETKEFFRKTVTRSADGRYQISLPWIEGHPPIGSNIYTAEKRVRNTARKLLSSGGYDDYENVFKELEELGAIEVVPQEEIEKTCHVLCHRPVYKPSSTTTKIRPVFDASCPTEVLSWKRPESDCHPTVADWSAVKRVSLNDCLRTGPNMLEMIVELLLRFREKSVGATADIRKAFLMIDIRPQDRDFVRFFWWEDKSLNKLKVYRHRRVVFGLTCSPYLLMAVIEHHLATQPAHLEETKKKLWRSLYVDNVVTTFETVAEYEKFRQDSTSMLAEAKFDLRMWESNCDDPAQLGISNVLGVKWDRQDDVLYCEILPTLFEEKKVTRRVILSTVAKIYDPLGLLAPVTLLPKVLIQDTWCRSLGWDEEVGEETVKQFASWLQHLKLIPEIRVPRCAMFGDRESWLLHAFSDASTIGLSAAIFIRSEFNEQVQVQLLIAKSRVAPLRKTTINRLELVACEMSARLAHTTVMAMDLQDIPIHYWTDSSTALAWIRRNDSWGTFVGNRVKKILSVSNTERWNHVPGAINPADLPSRGCDANFLLESKWWEGPSWLRQSSSEWPSGHEDTNEEDVMLEKKKTVVTQVAVVPDRWYDRRHPEVTSWNKILHSVAYMLRFIRRPAPMTVYLDNEELHRAERKLFVIIQSQSFGEKPTFNLDVIKDAEGLYRVQTKLTMRKDTEDFKYPVLLPSNHELVGRLIMDRHVFNCHAGAQFLMSSLRENVWILKSRRTIDRVLKKCRVCKLQRAKAATVKVAPLPENRVRDAEVFEVIGIDAACPLYIRDGTKTWIMLFTCAVTRAVHLELVSSMSAECFLLSLRRFIARCRRPEVIYTDNGTNFAASAKLLAKIDWEKIRQNSDCQRMKWVFNPPSSPWWGGWWERLVRTVKELLVRVLGKRVLNLEELSTVLCDIEAVINGRPLTYVFEGDEFIPLTPMMLTRGVKHSGVVDLDYLDSKGFQKRYRLRQRLIEDLRHRFRREYLAQLVQRKGESKGSPVIKVGDVVLIGCDNKKRLHWPMGKVVETVTGRDGFVRVAKVKTTTGILTRPLQRLYSLEVQEEELEEKEEPIHEHTEPDETEHGTFRNRFGRLVRKIKYNV